LFFSVTGQADCTALKFFAGNNFNAQKPLSIVANIKPTPENVLTCTFATLNGTLENRDASL